ncbi:MAG: MFS transporter [Chloroflexota bacterium]
MIKRTISKGRHSGGRKVFGLNPNVFFLGLVSLLTDISSEMIFTLVPLFLANVLGAVTTVIGFVGGLSESTDAIFRIASGWFSDKIGKRKPLALAGYSISTLAKPFMYLAANWGAVAAIRFGDRIGKGIRSSPRDALVADSVSSSERGRGFGLHRAMDSIGATIGLIAAAVIIYQVQGGGMELGLETYRWLVLAGTIPAVLAVLVLFFFVRERRKGRLTKDNVSEKICKGKLGSGFGLRFKLFLAVMAVFTLGNSSDFFVILRAQDLQAPLVQVTLMLVLFNITYAAVSWPAGVLSDKLSRKGIIAIDWFIYTLVYLGFALSSSLWQIWLLFASYGIYYGIVEGVARAFVADLVPVERRGTAYGLYHGVIGLTLLPASLIAGWLWDAVNPAAPFYLGAGLAFLAMLGLMGLVRE